MSKQKEVLNASEAREKFTKLVGAAARGERVFIRHRENGVVVMMSGLEFESIEASQRMLRDLELQRDIEARRTRSRKDMLSYGEWRRSVGIAV